MYEKCWRLFESLAELELSCIALKHMNNMMSIPNLIFPKYNPKEKKNVTDSSTWSKLTSHEVTVSLTRMLARALSRGGPGVRRWTTAMRLWIV
jgi:hypothetical protein